MANGEDQSEESSNFLAGISSFLVMALFVPGAISACFAQWLIRGDSIFEFFSSEKCTLTGGIAASLFTGLIVTPLALLCERPFKFLRVIIQKMLRMPPPRQNYLDLTKDVIKWERRKLIGWYFFQVWGQFIMHWNISIGLLPIAAFYTLRGFRSGQLTLHGSIWDLNLKFAIIILTILVNLIASAIFECAHKANIDAAHELKGKKGD